MSIIVNDPLTNPPTAKTYETASGPVPDIGEYLLRDLLGLHLVPMALWEVQRLADAAQPPRAVLSVGVQRQGMIAI